MSARGLYTLCLILLLTGKAAPLLADDPVPPTQRCGVDCPPCNMLPLTEEPVIPSVASPDCCAANRF
jgi:hypothetical protein